MTSCVGAGATVLQLIFTCEIICSGTRVFPLIVSRLCRENDRNVRDGEMGRLHVQAPWLTSCEPRSCNTYTVSAQLNLHLTIVYLILLLLAIS